MAIQNAWQKLDVYWRLSDGAETVTIMTTIVRLDKAEQHHVRQSHPGGAIATITTAADMRLAGDTESNVAARNE